MWLFHSLMKTIKFSLFHFAFIIFNACGFVQFIINLLLCWLKRGCRFRNNAICFRPVIIWEKEDTRHSFENEIFHIYFYIYLQFLNSQVSPLSYITPHNVLRESVFSSHLMMTRCQATHAECGSVLSGWKKQGCF